MRRTRTPNGNIVAIMVGAGAITNAWSPIIRALQPYYEPTLTADGANAVLARLVYLLRWYASLPGDQGKTQLAEVKRFAAEIKRRLCEELTAAESSGELSARPELFEIFDRLVAPRSRGLMLITTNWDRVVERSLSAHINKKFRCDLHALHIHGSIARGETLYLPTEVTRESYREADEGEEIGSIHGAIMRGLEQARWGIVYGLSLSPLDAELGQTLAAGWSNPFMEQLDVIVPDHEVVAHRVNVLLERRRAVKVVGYDPANLAQPVDYTVPFRPPSPDV